MGGVQRKPLKFLRSPPSKGAEKGKKLGRNLLDAIDALQFFWLQVRWAGHGIFAKGRLLAGSWHFTQAKRLELCFGWHKNRMNHGVCWMGKFRML